MTLNQQSIAWAAVVALTGTVHVLRFLDARAQRNWTRTP
jgi:hypothetical protein